MKSYQKMELALLVPLVLALSVRALNTSPDFSGIEPLRAMMVRAGENVSIPCDTEEHQEWFFCLWRHPSGVTVNSLL